MISISKRLSGETLESRLAARHEEFELVTRLEDYTSRQQQHLEFRCRKCNHVQRKTLQAFERGSLCEMCFPVSASQWQVEIEEWIRSLGVDVRREDREQLAPKEIDIYIPAARLGIECHGLYFHSDAKDGNNPKAHLTKASMADAHGIRLLQVFFDEWRDRKEVVKGMILSRLGMSTRRVGARKCDVVEVAPVQQRVFFEKSHLAGHAGSKICWGLVSDGELIACLSLRSPRQKRWSSWYEVSRFATLPGVSVSGGLSRLVKVAHAWSRSQGKLGVMTYVDRRVGTGESYRKCGFVDAGVTGPDYWYTDFTNRFDRFKFRAQAGKSELEVAREAKVFRVWGAGSRVLLHGQ
jgi:hypothetical protein